MREMVVTTMKEWEEEMHNYMVEGMEEVEEEREITGDPRMWIHLRATGGFDGETLNGI